MAKSKVDEKVVSMKFDNKDFEKNVSTTMSSLDKLKQKLSFKGASQGLDDLSKSARKIDFSHMENAVDGLKVKFSALQVVGTTALVNITNSAMNAGKNIIKALTIDPVLSGLQEYETQINAIQTIMANTQSKGTTLQQVNQSLNELNTYADKTIYNFTEMTRNIGTFTAAGVGLKDATSSIQGIANLAAVSGSNAQQAAVAMYQLSQAMAAGTVKLMDWNSVVNAGMGGQVFQEALKKTARVHGVAVDQMIAEEGSFRESLKNGWITTEILTETLSKMTKSGAAEYLSNLTGVEVSQITAAQKLAYETKDSAGAYNGLAEAMAATGKISKEEVLDILNLADTAEEAATEVKTFTQLVDTLKEALQSGWTKSWELIIGDFQEAKDIYTEISNALGGIISTWSDTRNELLSKTLSTGWKQLLTEGISDAEGYQEMMKQVAREHGIAVDDIVKKNGTFEKSLKDGWATSEILTEATERFTQKFSALSQEELKAAGFTKEDAEALQQLNEQVKNGTINMKEFSEKMTRPSGRELLFDTLKNAGKAVVKVFETLKQAWDDVFHPKTTDEQASALYNIIAAINKFSQALILSDDKAEKLRQTIAGLLSPFGLLWDIISTVGKTLFQTFFNLGGAVDGANGGILSITATIGKFVKKVVDAIRESYVFNDALTLFNFILTKTASVISWVVQRIKDFVHNNELMVYVLQAGHQLVGMLRDKFQEYFETFKDGVRHVKDMVKQSEKLREAISKLKSVLQNGKGAIKNWVQGFKEAENMPKYIFEGLVNGLKELIPKVLETGKELAKSIIEAVKNVLGIHSPSTVFEEIGENIGQGLLNGLGKMTGKIIDAFGGLFTNILNDVKNMNLGTIFSGVMAGGLIVSINKLSTAILNFSTPFKSVTKVIDNAAGVLAAFKGAITNIGKAEALNLKSQAIKNIAISIAILAGSLIALTLVDPGKLKDALITIGILAGIMAGLIALTALLEKTTISLDKAGLKIQGARSMLITFAATMLMLAVVIKLIGGMKLEQAIQGLVGIRVLLGLMAGMLFAYSKIISKSQADADKISSFGTNLLKIAGSLIMMALVIRILGKMKVEQAIQGTIVITAFGGIIVGLMASMKLLTRSTNVDKIGGTLLKVAGAIAIMAIVVKLLGGMSIPDLVKGTVVVAAFAGIIVGLIAATKLLKGSKYIESAGKTILGIGGAIALMAISARILGSMDVASLAKGVVCVTIFAAIAGALVLVVSKSGGKGGALGTAATMVSLAMAIAIMSAAMLIVSFMPVTGLAKGLVAMEMMSVFVSLMVVCAKKAKDVKGTIMGLTFAIGVMAASILVLSFIDPSRLMPATIALSLVMSMFALIESQAKRIKGVMKSIIPMTLMVAALSGMIYLLSSCSPEGAISAAAGLSVLLLAMSGTIAILHNFTKRYNPAKTLKVMAPLLLIITALGAVVAALCFINPSGALPVSLSLSVLLLAMVGVLKLLELINVSSMKGVGALAILTVIVGGLAVIISLLNGLNPEQAIAISVALTTMLLGMSAVLGVLTLVGLGGPAAFIGLAALGTLIAGLGVLLVAIGGLNTLIPQLEEFLDKGIVVLEKIGYALGSFFGNIVAGFTEAVFSTLPQVGASLSAFMVNLMPFLTGLSFVDEGKINAVGNLAAMIAIIGGAEIVNAIASFLSGGDAVDKFGTQIESLGAHIAVFGEEVKDIDESKVTAAANAGKMLSELAMNVPAEGGLLQGLFGIQDLESFGEKIKAFGHAMCDFSAIVSGEGSINPAAITAAANAGRIMTELANNIPNSGGLLTGIFGDNDLADFGEKIKSFGYAMVDFSNAVSQNGGINIAAVEAARTAGMIMVELQNSVPKMSGLISVLEGTNDLGTFGEKIKQFGESMVNFSKAVSEEGAINPEAVQAAANCGEIMSKLQAALPDDPSAWDKMFGSGGTMGLEAFGGKIAEFGKGIKSFSKEVEGIDPNMIGTFSDEAGKLVGLFKGLEGINSENIDAFCNGIKSLAESGISGLKDAFNEEGVGDVAGALQSLINQCSEVIKGGKGIFQQAGNELAWGLHDGMCQIEGDIRGAAESLKNNALEGLGDTYQTFMTPGNWAAWGFKDGILNESYQVQGIGGRLKDAAIEGLGDTYQTFMTPGRWAAWGFKDGMLGELGQVANAGTQLGRSALESAKRAIDSQSPSKEFMKLGNYSSEGMAIGITQMADVAQTASYEMAKSTVDAAAQGVYDANQNGLNLTPSISPVVDFNNMKTATLDLTGNLTTTLVKPVSSMSTLMTSAQDATIKSNNQVIEAIDKFREDFGAMLDMDDNKEFAIYLDSRKVASSIAKPMNQELGVLQKRGEY